MITKDHAEQIIRFLGAKPEEKVTIIGDNTTGSLVFQLYIAMKKTQGFRPHLWSIDDYERPLASVPEDLAEQVTGRDLVFYAVDKRADENINELSFRRELNKIVEDSGGRVGNMMGINTEVIESAFAHDAGEIKDLTMRLHEYMQGVGKIRVVTTEGTNAVFEFDPRYKWVAATGEIEKGKTRNVMPAEVFTHPADVNGTIVITGSYGYLGALPEFKDNADTLERIAKNPIVWDVKNGSICSVMCNDREIERAVAAAVFGVENGHRIGEYGMGTNLGIKRLLGVTMHDEKYPGVHIANGGGLPHATGATHYSSPAHYDGVIKGATVIDLDDGTTLMRQGKYMDLFK